MGAWHGINSHLQKQKHGMGQDREGVLLYHRLLSRINFFYCRFYILFYIRIMNMYIYFITSFLKRILLSLYPLKKERHYESLAFVQFGLIHARADL